MLGGIPTLDLLVELERRSTPNRRVVRDQDRRDQVLWTLETLQPGDYPLQLHKLSPLCGVSTVELTRMARDEYGLCVEIRPNGETAYCRATGDTLNWRRQRGNL